MAWAQEGHWLPANAKSLGIPMRRVTVRNGSARSRKPDALQALRQEVRRDLLAESRKHSATELLCQIPCIGPIRAAQLIALMQTPHRFRTKRQLWTYSGLGLETHASSQYCYVNGQL